MRSARAIRKEILNLIKTFAEVCDDYAIIANQIMPNIFNVILAEFVSSNVETRESEVIDLVSGIVIKLKEHTPNFEVILDQFIN
jgi:exportin-1